MLLTALTALVSSLAALQEPAALEPLDHAHLSAELRALEAAHPDLVELQKLGESRAGRAVEGLRIAGPRADLVDPRPAILLVANVDGPRLFASSIALDHARRLAEGYASADAVRGFLDSTIVYVVPRANPDAAEARFATPRREEHASGPGVDDDRDGRQGEDPPADLDGDGMVAWLRVKDPDGTWREDPTDARVLVEADRNKGEAGVYALWPEGRDTDGDEAVAEDAPLDARVDRNFPAGWTAHERGSGAFPTDEPEARGLCDFVIAHKELALVVVYDASDNLLADVKSVGDDAPNVKRIPPEGVLESDAKLLGELGKRYRKATEREGKSEGKGGGKTEGGDGGTFARWCYEHRGLFTLTSSLWDVPLEDAKNKEEKKEGENAEGAEKGDAESAEKKPEAGKQEEAKKEGEKKEGEKGGGKKEDEPKPSDDAKRLRWIDAQGAAEAWRFLPWKSFQHPELGAVEIGGFAPFARLEPPASEREPIATRHFTHFLTLGALLPRVAVSECTREQLGEGVQRVTAVVQDDAFLPLYSRSARRTSTIRPAKVVLVLPEAGKLLAGNSQELLSELSGSGGRKEYTWLVQGPKEMELGVSVETDHAGRAFRKAEEKP